MRFFLEHRRPPSAPRECGALSNPHALSSLPQLLAPARLLLLAGEWGWSPGERLRLPTVLPGATEVRWGSCGPWGSGHQRVWLAPSASSQDAWDGVRVSVLAEVGPLLPHFSFPGSLAIKMCLENECRLFIS